MIDFDPTEVDRAWAAGLFEGEGSFCWQRTDGRDYPRAHLGTTDPDVLRRFAKIVGVGRIYGPRYHRPSHWKPIEDWVACGIDNISLLAEVIGPYLGERRSAKLGEMLSWKPAERIRRDYCNEPLVPSSAGHTAHLAYGEKPCDRCRMSRNLYMRQWRDQRVR